MRNKIKKVIPYKPSPVSKPVHEDVGLAHAVFGSSRYNMIICASALAHEINATIGAVMPAHKPTVQALVQIQEGKFTQEMGEQLMIEQRLRRMGPAR